MECGGSCLIQACPGHELWTLESDSSATRQACSVVQGCGQVPGCKEERRLQRHGMRCLNNTMVDLFQRLPAKFFGMVRKTSNIQGGPIQRSTFVPVLPSVTCIDLFGRHACTTVTSCSTNASCYLCHRKRCPPAPTHGCGLVNGTKDSHLRNPSS